MTKLIAVIEDEQKRGEGMTSTVIIERWKWLMVNNEVTELKEMLGAKNELTKKVGLPQMMDDKKEGEWMTRLW